MAMIESSAARVLAAHAYRRALEQKGSKGQRFTHAVIQRYLSGAHLGTLFQQLADLGMNMEDRGNARQASSDLLQNVCGYTGIDFILRVVAPTDIVVPVARQRTQQG